MPKQPHFERIARVLALSILIGWSVAKVSAQQAPARPPSDDASAEVISNSAVEISATAEKLGFRLKSLESIDQRLTPLVASEAIVGCNALILKDDQEVFYGQWGQRDREQAEPMTRDTIFRIYSMSKPVTSIAVMQLVEQGKLDLDVPVAEYLPEFTNLKVLENQIGPAGGGATQTTDDNS